MRLRIDLHVHTYFSPDSVITPKDLFYYVKKRGLDGVAITDHDRVDGALRMIKEKSFLVIPGIEISSQNGHIIGLNVNDVVPPELSAEETVERIHEAGGLAVACHPVTFLKKSLKGSITSHFDAVEVINSLAFPFKYSIRHSRRVALSLGIAQVAGSDAHYGPEIGNAYTVLDSDSEIENVIEAIRRGSCSPCGRATPFRIRLEREIMVLKRKVS